MLKLSVMVVKQILEKTGVFASSLLVTVFAVFMYSPTNGTNATSTAADNGTNADITVNIGSTLSMALSSDEAVMNGAPGEIVTSTPLTVYGQTNHLYGLAVLISDADDDIALHHEATEAKLTSIASDVNLFG